jgi:hypothetical protein
MEDDDYRIHYTITSHAFRRLYFSAVEMNNTCKAAEIFGANESYSVGRVVERELSVLKRGQREGGRSRLTSSATATRSSYSSGAP